jgi:CheY-like chemotaxis protein
MADILVIDPSPAQRDRLAQRLAQWGHWVVTATDSAHGLTYARTAQFDLILLDVEGTGRGGLDIARHLKAAPGTAATPLLALTTSQAGDLRAQYLAAGCDDCEPKPLDMIHLQATIHSLCIHAPVSRAQGDCIRVCS